MRQSSQPTTASTVGMSRRSLGLALGGVVLLAGPLAGCDLDDLTGRGPGGPLGTGDEPADDPDRVLVDTVVADLDTQLAGVASVRTLQRLRAPLGPLAQMHRAHRAVPDPGDADGADATSTAPSPTLPAPSAVLDPSDAARAVRVLLTDTTAYQQRLVAAALAARSGALATLLASMSASVAQHLAVLPADLGGPA